MGFELTERIQALPPYLLFEIAARKRAAIAAGRDVIDFGVGDPDEPTPDFIIQRMIAAVQRPENHRYSLGGGRPEFRTTMAAFFERRYGVQLDPQRELLALIGTKEGIGHLPLAVANPGQTVIIPSPGYPAYRAGTIFAGGVPYVLGLTAEGGWLPDFDAIPSDVARRAVLMFINYPNNPTGAVATLDLFRRAVEFAREHDLVLAQDAAYNDLYLGAERPPSVLEVPGAREVAIEFHSTSKTFNMTGWRAGFVAGNAEVIAALARIKSNLDTGLFAAVQEAACEAYAGIDRPEIEAGRVRYRRRAEMMSAGLRELGFGAEVPPATFYLWARVPEGYDSMTVCNRLLDEVGIVGVPGVGFGPTGEGYVRFSLGVPDARIAEAVERLRGLQW